VPREFDGAPWGCVCVALFGIVTVPGSFFKAGDLGCGEGTGTDLGESWTKK